MGVSSITDTYGREFKTLRISLTNVCNLGCIYCTDDKPSPRLAKTGNILSASNLIDLVKSIHLLVGLETVRLTGGEPTLYKDLITLTQGLKHLGISKIKMTSNGYNLKSKVRDLAEAGLTSINISLDAIKEEAFYKMSGRKNLQKIIEGIEEALLADISVKLNAVIMKGKNEDQILPLLAFAQSRNIPIRFLELMKMGHLDEENLRLYFFSEEDILGVIGKEVKVSRVLRKRSSTGNYWITEEGQRFGIIANESSPFCHDCNRLRVDSFGNIYGCLSENKPIPIFPHLNEPRIIAEKLKEALAHKQPVKFKGSEISMLAIGG